jgi:hypothetical protein
MRRTTVNLKTALRIRQTFIIVFLILCGIILSIAAANAKTRTSDKHMSSVRKQNKRYANACQLLEDKRNKKEKAKVHRYKYR